AGPPFSPPVNWSQQFARLLHSWLSSPWRERLVRRTTDDPLCVDDRNFNKVEKWTKDGTKVDSLVYAGNNLDKARDIFANAIKHRPRIRLTIRQRTRVVQQWPRD